MTIEIQRGTVVTVERGSNKVRAGQGLIKGLGVIWKHWVASFGKNDHYSKTQGTFTIEYPEERRQLPDVYRNMPILLYDDATGHELCTSCFQCQRICPPQVIHMTQAKDPATGKPVPAVAEFLVEYDACMSCGFCAEVCPFDAIKMDHLYELATADHPSLTVDKRGLNRPVSYYERIAPALWAEAKESATKKLQGNMRRRSGSIGIAPQVVDVRQETGDRRQETVVEAQQTATAPTAVVAPAAPDDKAARLAAIRAAKQAQQTSANDAVGANPDTPATPPIAPDDKAARLAAIRAANAVKKANTNDAVGAQQAFTPSTPDAVAPAALPPANETHTTPEATAAPNDKAARLAAIRAANAAKKAAAAGSEGDDA